MLDNTSDGHNRRAFRVADLGGHGCAIEQIIDLVPSCTLGAKARECDPYSRARWVQQEIDSVAR